MAGFLKREAYFVPRASLKFPNADIFFYVKELLPKYTEWTRQQQHGRRGDNSILCQRFLYQIIPFFVETLMQDGTYFI